MSNAPRSWRPPERTKLLVPQAPNSLVGNEVKISGMKITTLGPQSQVVVNKDKCSVCRHIVREGEVVLLHSVRVNFSNSYTLVRWVVVHKSPCLVNMVGEAPQEDYELIKERLLNGGGLFDDT